MIAAGAAGVAVGSRFPHPLAGALGAMALLFSSVTSHLASGAASWLAPWQMEADQLASLPGPLAGYPPAGAHVAELAGLAVLNHLVSEVADPASAQRCATASQVRYCLYPGFGSLLPSLEDPVGGVLARLPARPAGPLTIRQVAGLSLPGSTLTHGYPRREVSRWIAQARKAPGNAAACTGRSRYADLGGAVAAPAGFAAIALAWYAPVTSGFMAEPSATPHGAAIAWYDVASAALALACVAMRDQWHRYARDLSARWPRWPPPS